MANRREFIKTGSTALLAGAFVTGNRAFAADKRNHENRGRIYSSYKGGAIGSSKEEMVKKLEMSRQLGFDGIECSGPAVNGLAGGVADAKSLRAASAQTGVPVHGVVDSVHWRQRLSSPDEKARQIGRETLEAAIQLSHDIGGTSVLLVPGKVAGEDENHDHVWQRSIIEIRKVLPLASRLGIHVLIENVWNGFCETPEQLRDYVDEIDSPWVGVYFDIGNVRKFGPSEDWIRVLGSRIIKLDVKDWGQKNGFCKLGEGDVNWPEVRKSLKETGFTGWSTREGSDGSLNETIRLMNELLDL